jgi:signal transduction histidine kinase
VVREKERARIAHEIHNDIGAALTVLKINLAMIEEHLARESSAHIERVHRMLESLDAMIDLVRSISRRLRPFLLDDVGLNAAIEWHVQDLHKRTGVLVQLSLPAEELELTEEVKETLFRVFQEASTNSLRHAGSRQLWVELTRNASEVCLTVRDDGPGITQDQIDNPSGFGLLGLKERIEQARGEFSIQGSPERGTEVTARVPHVETEDGDDPSPDR